MRSEILRLFQNLNICIHFNQIFTKRLPQEDLQFVTFWLLSYKNCCHSNTFEFWGSYKFDFHYSLNLCMDFHEMFLKWIVGIIISLCFSDASRLWGCSNCDAIFLFLIAITLYCFGFFKLWSQYLKTLYGNAKMQ